MYVTVGEKRKGLIFTRWSPREMCYDVGTRILYYSAKGIASPTAARHQDPYGNSSNSGRWKAMKVMRIKAMAEETSMSKTSYKESNSEMLALSFLGVPMDPESLPPESEWMKPPLCPAVGPVRDYDDLREDTDSFFRDPFHQKDLFELVRDYRRVMQRERELRRAREREQRRLEEQQQRAADGMVDSDGSRSTSRSQTPIPSLGQSPGPEAGTMPNLTSLSSLLFRFSCHYELWRFFLVVSFTLGYDALQASPYNGYPPYDPRNSISFSPPPPQLWACLRGAIAAYHPYIFLHSNLIGKSDDGFSFYAVAENGFLCLSHDAIFYVGEDGRTLQWVKLLAVESMVYNSMCQKPFAIFRTDPGKPDVIVEVTPDFRCRMFPPEVKDSRSNPQWFSVFQLRRFANAVLMSFSSTEIRRYIKIKEIEVPTVREGLFVVPATPASYPREMTYPTAPGSPTSPGSPGTPGSPAIEDPMAVDLTLAIKRKNYEPFTTRKLPLKKAWRIASDARSDLNPEVVANAAVPLYDDGAVNAPLTPRQVELARQLCEEEEEEKVVGVSMDTLRTVDAQAADGPFNFALSPVVRIVSPTIEEEWERDYSMIGEYLVAGSTTHPNDASHTLLPT